MIRTWAGILTLVAICVGGMVFYSGYIVIVTTLSWIAKIFGCSHAKTA